jgi:hypothetical protein
VPDLRQLPHHRRVPAPAPRAAHATEQLIAQAEADERRRLIEMNEPVRLNLIRIMDGLEALEDDDGR